MKNREASKLLLHELYCLVRAIYPNKRTENPYHQNLKHLNETLTIKDRLLLKEIISCLTLLNHKERDQVRDKYLSSYYDILQALELMNGYTIGLKVWQFYEQITEIFQDEEFTKHDIMLKLKISDSATKRYLKILKDLQLVEDTGIVRNKRFYYRIGTYTKMESQQEIEEEIFGEFENEVYWQDYQMRT